MIRMHRLILAAAMLLAGIAPLAAQTSPPRGSPQRAELMDALRPTAMTEIGGPIEFVVKELRVIPPWAYVFVRPQRPGGAPIDWRRTKFREDYEAGILGDDIMALLRHDGARWNVVEYAIGPSDVAWDGWRQERRLPRRLFTDQ